MFPLASGFIPTGNEGNVKFGVQKLHDVCAAYKNYRI
jgi:hypothetical protein